MRFKIALLILGQLFLLGTTAQVSSTSPYSNYGIGETSNNTNIAGISMGGVSISNLDSSNLNISNPASYAFISEGKPILSISGRGTFSQYQTNSSELTTSLFALNNVAISFPIKKNWGLTIGLNPFSSVGYNIQERFTFDNKTVRASYVGDGAINKVFAGLAYRPWRDTTNQLSFGFNIGYLFGSIGRSRSHEFIDNPTYFNTKSQESIKVSDLYFDAGIMYQRRLTRNSFLTVGANYVLGKNINADKENYDYSFGGELGNENFQDTIGYSLQEGGSIMIPHKFGVGLTYELFGNRYYTNDKLDFLLKIGLDYSMQDWTKYSVNFNGTNEGDSLNASSRVSLGFEFTPSLNTIYKPKVNYFKTMKYRIGGHYGLLPYSVNGSQLTEFGMSFGLGLPVPIKYTNASVNLGMNFGQKGTTDNNLVRERYMGVYIGLSLSPSVKWFQKRKYD